MLKVFFVHELRYVFTLLITMFISVAIRTVATILHHVFSQAETLIEPAVDIYYVKFVHVAPSHQDLNAQFATRTFVMARFKSS
jgi:hypothetical protein